MNDEILPEFVGRWDLQGNVTDASTGEKTTYADWVLSWESRLEETFTRFMDRRDLRSDIQNLPGRKPHFCDDWYGVYPEQVSNRGFYPGELGND